MSVDCSQDLRPKIRFKGPQNPRRSLQTVYRSSTTPPLWVALSGGNRKVRTPRVFLGPIGQRRALWAPNWLGLCGPPLLPDPKYVPARISDAKLMPHKTYAVVAHALSLAYMGKSWQTSVIIINHYHWHCSIFKLTDPASFQIRAMLDARSSVTCNM